MYLISVPLSNKCVAKQCRRLRIPTNLFVLAYKVQEQELREKLNTEVIFSSNWEKMIEKGLKLAENISEI